MIKKILSMILALCLVLGLLPATAFATEENVVYLSVSFDGKYIDDKNGAPIAYFPVSLDTIAAVDLEEYGLDNMLFDADGDGNYETTALQLLIYAHEELYGGDWSEVNFDAIPGGSYFAGGIFGFTENLVYFHNGDFPVDETQQSDYMTVGATSDRIVLEAGDFLDVASFGCYAFLWDQAGGFHLFADPNGSYVHDYTVSEGEALPIKVMHSFCDLMYGQAWVYEATDYEVYYGTAFGEAEGSVTTDGSGCAEITFPNAGTYYVWCDGDNGSDDGTHGSCDYCLETGEPCIVSAPAYAKVTVKGAAKTIAVGDRYFSTLEEAFVYQTESGAECVSLSGNLTVADLELPAGAVLDLNGYTLTADSFDAAGDIIDKTEGDGLLVVKGDCIFDVGNSYLPIYDNAKVGYRLFTVKVNSVAVTGTKGATPKYWFKVVFDNFDDVYALIQAESDVDIKVNVTWDDNEVGAVAVADDAFVEKWADIYINNKDIYIITTLVDTEGKANISVIPGIGANGVDITGDAL